MNTEFRTAPSPPKPTILIVSPYYAPGYKIVGGPVQSLTSLVHLLASEFDFRIITADREPGEPDRYPGIVSGTWQLVKDAEVFYTAPGLRNTVGLLQVLQGTFCDIVYFNSVFSFRFTVLPLIARRFSRSPGVLDIVAPRGELAADAIVKKRGAKRLFLRIARMFGLYKDVLWQAASAQEAEDIRRVFGSGARIYIAPDLSMIESREHYRQLPKEKGSLRVVFIGRIAPIKNLRGALEALGRVSGRLRFAIYGPIVDPDYWRECRSLIEALSSRATIKYFGMLQPAEVAPTLARYDVCLAPSLSESFGHSILQALVAGCPVITSYRTPWEGLENARAGKQAQLGSPDGLSAAIQAFVDMGEFEHAEYRRGARAYGIARQSSAADKTVTVALFLNALAQRHAGSPLAEHIPPPKLLNS